MEEVLSISLTPTSAVDKMQQLPMSKKNAEGSTTKIQVGNIVIGQDFLVIAGPCAIESEEQVLKTAFAVKRAGANMLRGGAFKPRSSPYSFQGLGETGLKYLKRAGREAGLPTITEVMDPREVELVSGYADILQIGSRNMQNFSLLMEAGKSKKPVMLKRGLCATIEEWLASAEYIMKEGNPNVILCERGIRSIETYTRNTLDVSAIAAIKDLTHLPIIADPSHATGRSELIAPMALSSIMSGCDGLMIEVHPSPCEALCDANQQLTPRQFEILMKDIKDTVELRKRINKRYVQRQMQELSVAE